MPRLTSPEESPPALCLRQSEDLGDRLEALGCLMVHRDAVVQKIRDCAILAVAGDGISNIAVNVQLFGDRSRDDPGCVAVNLARADVIVGRRDHKRERSERRAAAKAG